MIIMTAPAIFYPPHQDDCTLSYGVDVINHLRAGRRVIIVLYTDGKGSFVQKVLNRETDPTTGNPYSSAYWGGYHSPSREGYSPLSDDEFSQARTNEYKSECPQLGVLPADVLVDFATTIDKEGLKTLIRKYEALYPGASHKAMSYYDTAIAHAASGQALNELYNAGEVSDARFYICRGDWAKSRPGSIVTPGADMSVLLKRAARCYEAWNPAQGSFAIGYHSVWYEFNEMLANPQNKVHKPNE
jgi:hypothetical protein